MNAAVMELLKYLYVGFRLIGQNVVVPNGKIVKRVLARTITEATHAGLIAFDPELDRYRLTDAGRQRVLVKERVNEFIDSITHSPIESC